MSVSIPDKMQGAVLPGNSTTELHEYPVRIDRFAFYDRTQSAFAVLMTGDTRKYGNLLLKKGVTPLPG